MPGLSFLCDFRGDLTQNESMISKALDSMLHYGHYKKNLLLKEREFILASTFYEEYPIKAFESEEFLIYLEGKIYDMSESLLEGYLYTLARNVFQCQDKSNEQIRDWLLKTDGDFVVFILHKSSNEVAIVNDALGHLPLYCYKTDDKLILSREIRFISKLINKATFDRMAIAQYLLFSFTLGKRTLLENVFRVEPSTLVKINFRNSKIEIINIHRFNFEKKKYWKRKIKENVNQLAVIFDEACKNRTKLEGYKDVLSLSGGLDSRAVGASLKENNLLLYGATYLDLENIHKKDAEVAEQIAKELNIDWTLFRINPPEGKDCLRLLKIKNGLNFLSMSYILPFLEDIKEKYGSNVNLFTGDGGDRTITCMIPYNKLKSPKDLLNYIVSTNQIFTLDVVSNITRIQKSEIIDNIISHVLSYPEKDFNQKYVHFMIYENAINWVGEGADRNRFYFWTSAPLWSIHFFNYAMNCPDRQKLYYNLYRKFLYKLSPKVAAIEYPNWNAPAMSKRLIVKLFIISKLPRKFKEVTKKWLATNASTYANDASIMKCLNDQLNSCDYFSEYLDSSKIRSNAVNYNKRQIETLFTITSYIEECKSNKSTIEKYSRAEFI
ncbi:MAG: asparagine synthase-related protein [Candidatus Scalindua sp.]|nr:asparagine synthase-related protein [Candidatus Scalindua sp.]